MLYLLVIYLYVKSGRSGVNYDLSCVFAELGSVTAILIASLEIKPKEILTFCFIYLCFTHTYNPFILSLQTRGPVLVTPPLTGLSKGCRGMTILDTRIWLKKTWSTFKPKSFIYHPCSEPHTRHPVPLLTTVYINNYDISFTMIKWDSHHNFNTTPYYNYIENNWKVREKELIVSCIYS